jgi:hypothetical protein
MSLFSFFSSREEKTLFLKEVLGKLEISREEKDLYFFSLEILDDSSFEIFFKNIKAQIVPSKKHQTIEPMSTTLL